MIVYVEGPPLCGKSTMLEQLGTPARDPFVTITQETPKYSTLPWESIARQYAFLGGHCTILEAGRRNKNRILLVSRSLHSSNIYTTPEVREEFRPHFEWWLDQASEDGLLLFLDIDWETVWERYQAGLDRADRRPGGYSPEELRRYYEAHQAIMQEYRDGRNDITSLIVSWPWEIEKVKYALHGVHLDLIRPRDIVKIHYGKD